MIILSPEKIEWGGDDAVTLRNFLASSTGQRMLEALAFMAPEILDGNHPNKALVASGRVAGYREALEVIVRLTHEDPNASPPPAESPNYANLDDDDAWKDIDSEVDKSTESTTS